MAKAYELELETLATELDEWRSSQNRRRRIPEPFWSKAAELVNELGITKVSTTLRLSFEGLKRRTLTSPVTTAAEEPAFLEWLIAPQVATCGHQTRSTICSKIRAEEFQEWLSFLEVSLFDKKNKKKVLAVIGGVLFCVVAIAFYIATKPSMLGQYTIDGVNLEATRDGLISELVLASNCDPENGILFFEKSNIGAVFTYTGLYSLEGDNVTVRGKSVSTGDDVVRVHGLLGSPTSVVNAPELGGQYFEDIYRYRNQVGFPSVTVTITYRDQVVEKCKLTRVLKTPEMAIKSFL